MPRLFNISALLERKSIYHISPEENNLFCPKEVQNIVSAINIRMNFCFDVANNIVHVEYILDMNNIDDTLTEASRYSTRIRWHYIAWDIKIRLDILNEVKNGFTWMNCFTQGSHKMAKACILK